MNLDAVKISPLGVSALMLSFGNEISPDLNDRVLEFDLLVNRRPFPGFMESVPAYSTLAIFYDAKNVNRTFPEFETAFEAVTSALKNLVREDKKKLKLTRRELTVPVNFDPKYGLDLALAAGKCGISIEEFKNIFCSTFYRVYFLGFLPGFAYMGEVDPRISLKRRSDPRKIVPAGSVAIAGNQAGIYPLESPGGWNIIGKTDLRLFDPQSEPPVYFRSGDLVRFVETTN